MVLVTGVRWAAALSQKGCAAAAILCSADCASRIAPGQRWIHPTPLWVVSELLREPEPSGGTRHPSALVEPGAQIADDVTLEAGAVVKAGAQIGAGSRIGAHAVVYGGAVLGERVSVGPGAVVGRPGFGWTASPQGKLVRVPQRGGVVIGNDVEVGPLCTIDAGTLGPTEIGDRVCLDAQVHVGHNAKIGSDTLVAAQSGFAGSVVIGRGVRVGGQAGFADHVTVGDGAQISAQSGVIGDIEAGARVAGFPAMASQRFFRAVARWLKPEQPRTGQKS